MLKLILAITLMVALSEASPAPHVPEAMKEKAIAAAKTFCSGKDQLEILGSVKEICKQHLDVSKPQKVLFHC